MVNRQRICMSILYHWSCDKDGWMAGGTFTPHVPLRVGPNNAARSTTARLVAVDGANPAPSSETAAFKSLSS